MFNNRYLVGGLLGGVGLGALLMSSTLSSEALRDFGEGLLGITAQTGALPFSISDLKADQASSSLSAPLKSEQVRELLQGGVFHSRNQNAKAIPIIGKYTLLGSALAQFEIGGMYLLGEGLPVDRQEGLRWLALAAAQGDRAAAQFAAAVIATPDWEKRVARLAAVRAILKRDRSDPDLGLASPDNHLPGPQDYVSAQSPGSSVSDSTSVYDQAVSRAMAGGTSTGSRNFIDQAYGSAPARTYSEVQVGRPPAGGAAPEFLNRAGPGTYSDGNGDIYTQAGPHGVINTRTGELSPTN